LDRGAREVSSHPYIAPFYQKKKKEKRSNLGGMRWGGGMALEGPRLAGQTGRIVIHPLEVKKVIPPSLVRLFQQKSFLKNNYLVE